MNFGQSSIFLWTIKYTVYKIELTTSVTKSDLCMLSVVEINSCSHSPQASPGSGPREFDPPNPPPSWRACSHVKDTDCGPHPAPGASQFGPRLKKEVSQKEESFFRLHVTFYQQVKQKISIGVPSREIYLSFLIYLIFAVLPL